MMAEVDAADFVLLVSTSTYRRRFEGQDAGKGKGATFEGLLAIQHLYDASTRNNKFVPVVFAGVAETDVPLVLRPYTRYTLPRRPHRAGRDRAAPVIPLDHRDPVRALGGREAGTHQAVLR